MPIRCDVRCKTLLENCGCGCVCAVPDKNNSRNAKVCRNMICHNCGSDSILWVRKIVKTQQSWFLRNKTILSVFLQVTFWGQRAVWAYQEGMLYLQTTLAILCFHGDGRHEEVLRTKVADVKQPHRREECWTAVKTPDMSLQPWKSGVPHATCRFTKLPSNVYHHMLSFPRSFFKICDSVMPSPAEILLEYFWQWGLQNLGYAIDFPRIPSKINRLLKEFLGESTLQTKIYPKYSV